MQFERNFRSIPSKDYMNKCKYNTQSQTTNHFFYIDPKSTSGDAGKNVHSFEETSSHIIDLMRRLYDPAAIKRSEQAHSKTTPSSGP